MFGASLLNGDLFVLISSTTLRTEYTVRSTWDETSADAKVKTSGTTMEPQKSKLGHLSHSCVKKTPDFIPHPLSIPHLHACVNVYSTYVCVCVCMRVERKCFLMTTSHCVLHSATHLPQCVHVTVCVHRIRQNDQTHRRWTVIKPHTCANILYTYIIISLHCCNSWHVYCRDNSIPPSAH